MGMQGYGVKENCFFRVRESRERGRNKKGDGESLLEEDWESKTRWVTYKNEI